MRFSAFAVAAFAAAVQASNDVTIFSTCYSTRTVERVVATSYVTAPAAMNTTWSSSAVAQPTAYPAVNSTVPVVQPQPTSPGVTNGASTLGVQAAGLAAFVGIVGAFLA